MNVFSLIGTGVAFKRYKSAKTEYEALLAKKAAIQATVDTYNEDKYVFDIPDEKPVEQIPGLKISSIVKIQKALLGKALYVSPSVVLTNTGTETITIQSIFADYTLFKQPLIIVTKDGQTVTSFVGYQTRGMITVDPEQTIEFAMPGGYTGWTEELGNAYSTTPRDQFTKSAKIQGALKTDFTVVWQDGGGQHRAVYTGISGVLEISDLTRSVFAA